MLRNDRQHAEARRLVVGLSATTRQIAKLGNSYADYGVESVVSELLLRLDVESQRVRLDIEQFQNGRFLQNAITEQSVFVLLSEVVKLPRSLIEARLALNWSQKDLADQTKIQPQHVSRYELNEYKNITLVKAVMISKVLSDEHAKRSRFIESVY